MTTLRGLSLAVVVWVAGIPTAAAQTAAERETARLLMDRGDEQVEAGDLEGALRLYRGAHEIMNVPSTGIEVARTQASLGHLVEARDTALQVLRIPVREGEPEPFTRARVAAEALSRELARQIPVLELEVHPVDARAELSLRIDGREVPRAAIGLPHALNPGEHRLELAASGFETLAQRVVLTIGERKSLSLRLRPSPTADSPESAKRPGSPGSFGSVASDPAELPALGPRSRDGGGAPPSSGLPWPVWVGAGTAGLGIAVGTIAGIVSLDRASDAKKFCNGNVCSTAARSDRDEALRAAHISNAGWAVATLGAALSVTSWLLSASPERAAPVASPVEVSSVPRGALLHWNGAPW